MLKNRIFARISYEIFKIPQKQFKIFAENFRMFSIFGGLALPLPARQAWSEVARFNNKISEFSGVGVGVVTENFFGVGVGFRNKKIDSAGFYS